MKMLKALRLQKGDRLKDIANLLGVTESAYHHYESGRNQPDIQSLQKLCEYYGVSMDVLTSDIDADPIFGRIIAEKPEAEFEDEMTIPIVASLRCGYGQAGEPFVVIGKHGVPKSFIKKYGSEIVLNYASGNSMIPTILPGELMVCYPSDMWEDGTVVIVNIDDSDTVKRIYHADDGGIDLIPDNPHYQIKHYSPQEIQDYQIHVLAHVITTIPQEIKPVPRRDA